MKVLYKNTNDFPVLLRGTEDSAGLDLCSAEFYEIDSKRVYAIRTGVYVAIPRGYYGQVALRSGFATSNEVVMLNAPGYIDSDYRGEIIVKVTCLNPYKIVDLQKGERFAQMAILPVPFIELEQVDELPPSLRQEGGFGSTGK